MAIDKDVPITAKKMFENYLYRVGLNPKSMHPIQYNEMKKVHYAAITSMMVVFQQPKITGQEMFKIMDGLDKEITQFWENQKSN